MGRSDLQRLSLESTGLSSNMKAIRRGVGDREYLCSEVRLGRRFIVDIYEGEQPEEGSRLGHGEGGEGRGQSPRVED